MKTKTYPFTPAGVDAKMDDLYAQSSSTIEAEAVAVSTNFFGWTSDNFDLTGEQTDYMESLGTAFATENGNDLAFAFRNRLTVTMTKGDVSIRTSKFIRKEKNVSTVSEPAEEEVISGGISYFVS